MCTFWEMYELMAKGSVGFDRSAACRMVLQSSRRSSGLSTEKLLWFLNSVVRLKWALMSVARIEPMTVLRISCRQKDRLSKGYSRQAGHSASKNRACLVPQIEGGRYDHVYPRPGAREKS